MCAMLDELPQALALVLVNDGDSSFLGFLDAWTVLDVLPSLLALGKCTEFVVLVQVDALIILCEVHIAIGVDVVDEQFIIEIDVVAIVLIRSVRIYLPYYLRVRLRADFDCEGTVASVCRLMQASEKGVAFHMAEDSLSAI